MSNSTRIATVVMAGAAAFYAELQWLGTDGATPRERRRVLPGDAPCRDPQATTPDAITIDRHRGGCGRGWCRWAGGG